ncbi:MAG TPA: hypothetical protein VJ911_05000, partial [Cryomorphaceae bacterium]|nr:hypothetical protein [Cryomorphaceae bacterium]
MFGETSPLLETDFFDEDCGVSPPTSTGQWFAFEGTGDVLNVSSCGTLFNSSISVFSGSCLNLNCIVDGFFENSECTDEGFDNALVSFQTSPGIPYYLYLFSNDGSVPASYTISATCEVPSPAPGNDSCESPLLLEINGPSLLATNLGSTSSGQTFENCTSISGEVTQNDVWFSFQAPESGRIVLETFAGSLQNTRMQIFDSCGGNTIACDEESGNGSMSRIELSCETYTPGQVYLIQLEGAGSMGTFSISITTESCELIFGCTNPDACNYNPAATIDNESCLIPLPGCHACVGDELVLIDADGDGVCDAEDECPNDPNKTIPGICGCGELEEDENANGICDVEETPSNDTPCTAMAIACGEIEIVVGTTFSATAQETCASGENRVGVWYQITVNETSVISLQTCFKQTDFNTEISVFSGTCDNLNCVPEVGETGLIPSGVNCESSPGTNGTQGEFIADPGAYYIMV